MWKRSIFLLLISNAIYAQELFPLNSNVWNIDAKSHTIETHAQQPAILIEQGYATLKDRTFKNGTIELDVFLKKEQGFPGVYFRQKQGQSEGFYLRPHLPGKPDATQAISVYNGLASWQIYFGPTYSFAYDFEYDRWTHVKLVVNGHKAQVFLDHATAPHLSWYLKHTPQAGAISLGGGGAAMHYANFTISSDSSLVQFNPIIEKARTNTIQEWTVSNKFYEAVLKNKNRLDSLLLSAKWEHELKADGTGIADLSKVVQRYEGQGNTVLVRCRINSSTSQTKLFHFGYSDRVVVLLNGQPLYQGNNQYRSRDYRFLGTIGLFDAVYLPLQKGANELILAVSEDFGGWGIIGKLDNEHNTTILETMEK